MARKTLRREKILPITFNLLNSIKEKTYHASLARFLFSLPKYAKPPFTRRMPFGWSHGFLRGIAAWGIWGFFEEIRVINEDNVPKEGAVIIVCTHHNMALDPAVLSCTFPHGRKLHYWVKSGLFANPVLAKILYNAGNICVNRKSKNNQELFKGTFDALAAGEIVALFPEGTSYTEPRITQVKDGASWAALEYMKWLKTEGKGTGAKEITIIPAGLVYTDKTRYRGTAIIEYGEPIQLSALTEQFMQDSPEAPKQAVKTLTKAIERSLVHLSVNADDWETVYSARMARALLWQNDRNVRLDDFAMVSQMLSDVFAGANECPSFLDTKYILLKYYALLQASGLSNGALAHLPLPKPGQQRRSGALPSRLSTVLPVAQSALSSLVRLPFFIIPFIIHTPVYSLARYGGNLSPVDEESHAQGKLVFGLIGTFLTYATIFFTVWGLLLLTPFGGVVAATAVLATAIYHVSLIDDNYKKAKQLLAAWRVLVGVWSPRSWDLPLSALGQYTTIKPPPPNPWIDRPLKKKGKQTEISTGSTNIVPESITTVPAESKESQKKNTSTPSYSLIRHVLRARVESSRALAKLFEELERVSPVIPISEHLGKPGLAGDHNADDDEGYLTARMSGAEIVHYLRMRGAKIPHLKNGRAGDWAHMDHSSDVDSTVVGGDSPDGYSKAKALTI